MKKEYEELNHILAKYFSLPLNHIMRHFLTLFFIICIAVSSNGQVKFKFNKAVITLQNDSVIEIDIQLQELYKINKQVVALTKGATRLFEVDEIKKLVVDNGENYEQIHVSINAIKQNVLARLIVKGKASLYEFDALLASWYAVTKNNYTTAFCDDNIDTLGGLNRHFPYRDSLYNILNENAFVRSKIVNLYYSRKDITDIIKLYNKEMNAEMIEYSFTIKRQNWLFTGANYTISNNNSIINYYVNYRVFLPRVDSKLSLNFGCTYNKFSYNHSYSYYAEFKVNQSMLLVPITFQYNFLNTNLRPYLNGGFILLAASKTSTENNPDNFEAPSVSKGVTPTLAGGIELNFTKNLLVKTELNYSSLYSGLQYSAGIAFCIDIK